MGERVMVFIDGSNMYFGLKDNLGRVDLNQKEFVDFLVSGRQLVRTYYYNARVDQAADPNRYRRQMRFFGAIEKIPYFSVAYGRLYARDVRLTCRKCKARFAVPAATCPECGEIHDCSVEVQKGVDVRIAIDLLVHGFKNHYDTAILVSGDGDLAEAVELITQEGKHVENAFFQKGSSPYLRNKCDVFIELTPQNLGPLML